MSSNFSSGCCHSFRRSFFVRSLADQRMARGSRRFRAGFLLAAIGAKDECRRKFVLACRAMGGMNLFEWNYALHLIECRLSLAHPIQGEFLHELHAVVSRQAANIIVTAARANCSADGVVEDQHFVDSDAAFVAR